MSDSFNHDTPNIDAPAIDMPTTDPVPQPFEVRFASRVDRLPPYMFGRINNSLYQKRRAGDDVIDLGMGNPSDPPDPMVVQKLADAAGQYRCSLLRPALPACRRCILGTL